MADDLLQTNQENAVAAGTSEAGRVLEAIADAGLPEVVASERDKALFNGMKNRLFLKFTLSDFEFLAYDIHVDEKYGGQS